MRLYNIVPIREELSWGVLQCIILGEEGRGRKRVIIPFPVCFFDEKASDYEIEQIHEGIPKIVRTGKSSEGWIARINCHCTYTRNTKGYYEIVSGNVQEIAKGHGAFGIAGRTGRWDDALIVIKPPYPAVIKVYPSGGRHKVMPYYLVFHEDWVDRVAEDEWRIYHLYF
jgi:hypothetical protein